MRQATGTGAFWDIVSARSITNAEESIRLGITQQSIMDHVRHSERTRVAQYYGLVQAGLHGARHLFQGLRRELYTEGNLAADRDVFVYSWRPNFDYEWSGSRFQGRPITRTPPAKRVFVVLATMLPAVDDDGVAGTILRWNWAVEDSELAEAPEGWRSRYGTLLWTRGKS